MRIVLASSEATPFSKTGGLADVAAALPKALAAAGHQVWLVIPNYPRVQAKQGARCPLIRTTGQTIDVAVGSKRVSGTLMWSELPGSDVTVFLIDQPNYFNRAGLYQAEGHDFPDNSERFIFFSRAVLQLANQLVLRPDVVHANDWQTGLIPALLKTEYRHVAGFERCGSVFTIHNMAYQGQFWHWDMLLTGLDWKYFNWRQMEAYGFLNLLKTGIGFADMVTTVSPSYAREIQTAEGGCGLHDALRARREDLVGILNGVDTEIWNPATDPALVRNYTVETVAEGKAICKAHLQNRMGLEVRGGVPLFGMISRMTDQKGLDLIEGCIDDLLHLDLQFAFLGTGDYHYERMLEELARRYPGRVSARIGFDEELAHQIEAGADAYLMPSRFEPCGLNQMYSLIYGTVPVVRRVGGLADSVVDANTANLANQTANGFCFENYESQALGRCVKRAFEAYHDRGMWQQLVQTGMRQDCSWNHSAAEYLQVYRRAQLKREREPSPPPG